ncbi:MAG TPA: endonuclease MutS2, partial [Treponema sp.]|nr:endonuclease MutS2 [Treponema sp.]
LIEKKAYVLVTTHHGVLKNYGFTHPSCVNASVAFDSTSLSPTYKILMGVPGESHAINIARKSGLPESIVEQAERYMAGGDADVSALIKALTEKLDGLSEKEKELEKKERLTHEAVKKADLKALRIRQQELQLKDAQIKESNRFLSDSRKMLENLVREIREAELTKATTKKVKDSIAALEAGLEDEKRRQDEKKEILAKDLDAQEKAADKSKSSKTKLEAKDFQKDDRVIINSTKMKGVIVSKDKKNSYLVLVGSVKMSVSKSNLSLDTREVQLGSPSIQFDAAPSSGDKPVFELRLLGMRGEEALQALEKQLELCILHAVSSFSIIHGKGDGILQNLVHEFLKNYPGIRSFDFAPPEDGGTGKTYVTL